MNAAFIRQLAEAHIRKVDGKGKGRVEDYFFLAMIDFFGEIAAQLAEANEHLAKIANPLMVVDPQPRWVWLNIADGMMQVFDREKIMCLTKRGDRLTIINDNWKQEHVVFMPIEEVCKKLGIPVGA